MKVPLEMLAQYDQQTCFICGRYLLNWGYKDISWQRLPTGKSHKKRPERYALFACPNCGRLAHKRCWYDHADRPEKRGLFRKGPWKMVCPSCGVQIGPERDERTPWDKGYEIPGHPDDTIPELYTSDVRSYRAGAWVRRVKESVLGFFRAVGLNTLNEEEMDAVSRAAARIGKTMSDIAGRVIRLDENGKKRDELLELRCVNCGAPLPLPEKGETATVCEHCGTAYLLPE